jgi:hypothetical protein
MGYYANADERGRLIAGLRALAEFLEADSTVPAPVWADVLVFPPCANNVEQRAEIDVIASRIGAEAREYVPGHYAASRSFGPVEYRAVAIDRDADADGA